MFNKVSVRDEYKPARNSGIWRIPNNSIIPLDQRKRVVKANRYLKHQSNRVYNIILSGDFEKGVRVITFLIENSTAYRVMWINKVAKGWYYNLSINSLKRILGRLDRIIYKADGNLRSSRTYIPKPDGRTRPLGVPSIEWRIINAMWTDFLYMILDRKIPKWQHGFRRNKSVLTAWKQIWKTYKKGSRIYEFDLKSFFNKLDLREVSRTLLEAGLPRSLVAYIERVNSMFPLIREEELQEEEEVKHIKYGSDYLTYKKGMPQGLPWSPLLAVFTLGKIFEEHEIKPIMFADDGIIILNKPQEEEMIKKTN